MRSNPGGSSPELLGGLILAILFLFASKYAFYAPRIAVGGETLQVYCDNWSVKIPAAMVETVSYNWTHSVERSPIVEVYKIRGGKLVLVEAKAKSFGTGHPYNAEEIGGNETLFENGWIVYTANYTVGSSVYVIGNPEFAGNYTVRFRDGYALFCNFTVGGLRVYR